MLERLARGCYRSRRLVVAGWLAALVGAVAASLAAGGEYRNNFDLGGTESQRAFDLLIERFPEFPVAGSAQIVFRAEAGVYDPSVQGRLTELFDRVASIDGVSSVTSPYSGPGIVSPDGTVSFASVQFEGSGPEVDFDVVLQVRDTVLAAGEDGIQVELGGRALEFAEREGPGSRESVGVMAAVVILLVTFGSVAAMGLPLVTAIIGLGIGLSLIVVLARLIEVAVFAPQLATMIGLGVGIDYALFIVTRYRQSLHEGMDPEGAVVAALRTSGRAVIFAGITVVISLMGMLLMGLPFVYGVTLAAALAVLLVVLASITLLPALLGFAGRAIDRLRVPRLGRPRAAESGLWFRWSRLVQRRPWWSMVGALVVLIALAAPVFSIRLGSADARNQPTTRTTRRAYDLLAAGFGPGFNGPFLLVSEVEGPDDVQSFQEATAAVASVDGVALVLPPRVNPAGDTAVSILFPTTAPQDVETERLVERLRHSVLPAAMPDAGGPGSRVLVSGVTPLFIDVSDLMTRRLPVFVAGVIALSFLLLMLVFRSVLVPVKAALMNVLGIASAFGVIVAIFQWGWGASLIGVGQSGPIESFLPMMLFALLFGLSMDYEVFLLSRIREEYDRTGDNSRAVADGLATTARVITAAAAIMVTLFLSFVFGDDRLIKLFGLGLAVAIFLDATVIRMVLVPATMELLGRANWWFPRSLERLLPTLAIEGSGHGRGPGRGTRHQASGAQLLQRRPASDAPDPTSQLPARTPPA